MKKRIALVSYKTCEISAYSVRNSGKTTQVFSVGDEFNPEENGAVVATVQEEDAGVAITIPNGTEFSTIRLNPMETERLLTALLAHQQLREGCSVDLYRKD